MLGGEHFGKNVLVALNKFPWLTPRGVNDVQDVPALWYITLGLNRADCTFL